MTPSEELIGFLVVDKPGGITSHDVVDRIRQRFHTRKVGHLGTLDPMATGVLPITIGKATRLARFVASTAKEYTGHIRLGQDTTTADADGVPMGEERPVHMDPEQVTGAMTAYLGSIQQVPPAYSAKKISGVRAHRLARRGVSVEMKPATVTIEAFELVDWSPPDLEFRVACSSGTYIRALARDLGASLGTGGHLRTLRRTRSGRFGIEDAVGLEEVGPEHLLGPEQVLGDLPRIEVDDDRIEFVANGREVECSTEAAADGADLCIFNKKGELIAVAAVNRGWAHPKVVLL